MITDKETIIKALEEHIANNSRDMLLSNKGVTYGDLLDFIKRQQEFLEGRKIRIEQANAEIMMYRQTVGTLAERNGEVVGLLRGKETRYIQKDIAEVFKRMAIDTARAEAIKEFKDLIINNLIEQTYGRDYLLCLIKEWAKEMTEE